MNKKDLIKIGILASQTWDIKFPPEIHFVPSSVPYLVEKRDNSYPPMKDYFKIDNDVIYFQTIRDSEGMNVSVGYSAKFNILAVAI